MIPEQNDLNYLRDMLWRGRSAVMVGSGLSLNAKRSGVSAPPFPTWSRLTAALVERLYCEGPDVESARTRAASTSGALRLADEYRAAHGPGALDEFLLAAIPDRQHEPGPLHRQLLELPWSDVFTTNWDTLLERATRGLVDRRYEVVVSSPEIARAARPRIVKLHGSFPSSGPFIVSEEQFRRYPLTHAPLVNLVQQSMMENAFVLLGFSGDDPNFLQWSGWIREHLGDQAPRIYLCGLLGLNNAQRRLLYERGVSPIDLSPHLEAGGLDAAERHRVALHWLVSFLDAGRPPDVLRWPSSPKRTSPLPADESAGLPPIPPPTALYLDEPLGPGGEMSVELILGRWRHNRRLYPGWVAPDATRNRLWRSTQFWIVDLLEYAVGTTLAERVDLLSELNWRLERCLIPLWPQIASPIAAVLEESDLFSDHPRIVDTGTIDASSDVRSAAIELAMSVLRHARESADDAAFDLWRSRLMALRGSRDGIDDAIQYQLCLRALGRMDHATARTLASEWTDGGDPAWSIRRASVLAEVGEDGKAGELAERALTGLRSLSHSDADGLAALSREGWAMTLLDASQGAGRMRGGLPIDRERHLERWARLERLGCDPRVEIDLLGERLDRAVPNYSPGPTRRIGFDPGTESRSISYHSGGTLRLAMPGLQAVRLCEEGGYPASCRGLGLGRTLLGKSAGWLAGVDPKLSHALLLRTSDRDTIRAQFTRGRVARLSTAEAVLLHGMADSALRDIVTIFTSAGLAGGGVAESASARLAGCVELASLMTIRLPEAEVEAALRRVVQYAASTQLAHIVMFGEHIDLLLRRLLAVASPSTISRQALAIFGLPIPGDGGFVAANPEYWPEPSIYLGPLSLDASTGGPGWEEVINHLIDVATSTLEVGDRSADVAREGGPLGARRRAVLRLAALRSRGMLTNEQIKAFEGAVWSRVGPHGIPIDTGLRNRDLIGLLTSRTAVRRKLLKAFYLQGNLPDFRKPGNSMNAPGEAGGYLDTIIGLSFLDGVWALGRKVAPIEWAATELEQILDKIESWWRREGEELSDRPEDFYITPIFQGRQRLILRFLDIVLLPRVPVGGTLAGRARDLVALLRSKGVPTALVLPRLVGHFPELAGLAAERIDAGIFSGDDALAEDALSGLRAWVADPEGCGGTQPPPGLMQAFAYTIRSRQRPALQWALIAARELVEDRDARGRLDPGFLDSILLGLESLRTEAVYQDEDGDDASIPEAEVPRYRRLAIRLAAALSRAGWADHSTVAGWLADTVDDPLPEVRRARVSKEE